MYKKKLLVLLLLVCFMLSACTSPFANHNKEAGAENTAVASGGATGSNGSGESDASGSASALDNPDASDNASASAELGLDDTSDVTIDENYTGGNLKIAVKDLDSTTFNVSEATVVSELFKPEDEEKTIELFDEDANITWKLTVPKGALLRDTEIKMTRIFNISGPEATGELECGVLLEPDGLQFIKPATLTAEGNYEHALAYSAKQDGSSLGVAWAERKDGGIVIPISHFSMYGLNQLTQDEYDKLKKTEVTKAKANLKEAIDEANKIAKEPITILPLPTWSRCLLHDQESEKTQKAYEELDTLCEKLASPESLILGKMIESLSVLSFFNGETMKEYEKPIGKMNYRLYRKAVKVLKEYGPNKDTIAPAIAISMRLLRDCSFLYGVTNEEIQEAFGMAGRYALQAGEAYYNDIVKWHDYCSFSAALELMRAASFFNYNEYKNSPVTFEILIAAMKFKFEFDGKITNYSKDNHTNTYTLNAKIPDIKDKYVNGQPVPNLGSGKVTAFESTDPAHMKAVLPAKFDVYCILDFHYPCEEELTVLLLDNLAPLSMTYYLQGEAGEKLDMPFFKNNWMPFFQPHLSDKGEGYHIEIHLVNGQASNKLEMTNSVNFGKIEYLFNLEHIPQ